MTNGNGYPTSWPDQSTVVVNRVVTERGAKGGQGNQGIQGPPGNAPYPSYVDVLTPPPDAHVGDSIINTGPDPIQIANIAIVAPGDTVKIASLDPFVVGSVGNLRGPVGATGAQGEVGLPGVDAGPMALYVPGTAPTPLPPAGWPGAWLATSYQVATAVTDGFDIRYRAQFTTQYGQATPPYGQSGLAGISNVFRLWLSAASASMEVVTSTWRASPTISAAQMGNPDEGDFVTVRFTYDAATGVFAAFTSSDGGGTWTPRGSVTRPAGQLPTPPNQDLMIGAHGRSGVATSAYPWRGGVEWFEVRTLAGALVCRADFRVPWTGSTWTDPTAKTWTLQNTTWWWSTSVPTRPRGTVTDAGGQVFNVEAFGATRNASTNQAPGIQAAIDAANAAWVASGPVGKRAQQTVQIPHGIFNVAVTTTGRVLASALIARSGVRIVGPGTLRVMDQQSTPVNPGGYFCVIGPTDAGAVAIDDFTIDGLNVDMNGSNQTNVWRTITGVSMTNGQVIVTAPTGTFSADDVGYALHGLPVGGGQQPVIQYFDSDTQVRVYTNTPAIATGTNLTVTVTTAIGRRFLAHYHGRNVKVLNCNFTDIGETYGTVVFTGTTNLGIPGNVGQHCVDCEVSGCRFTGVANEPVGSPGGWHDTVIVFFAGNGFRAHNNYFAAAGKSRYGTSGAFELHGRNITATGNRVVDFMGGISLVAGLAGDIPAQNGTVCGNVVENCASGMGVAAGQYATRPTGTFPGFENALFADNIVIVDRDQWTATPALAASRNPYFAGISVAEYTNSGVAKNVSVHHNLIRFLPYANRIAGEARMAGVRVSGTSEFWPDRNLGGAICHEDVSVTDNYIEAPPGHGIWVDGRARRLNISGNRIVNPAEAAPETSTGPPGFAGIGVAIRGYSQAELDRLSDAGFEPLAHQAEDWTINGNVISDSRPSRFLAYGILVNVSNVPSLAGGVVTDNTIRAGDDTVIVPWYITGGRTGEFFIRFRTPVTQNPAAQVAARFGSTWIDEAAGRVWIQTGVGDGSATPAVWQQMVIP